MRKRAGALSLAIPASRGIVHRVVHRFAHKFVASAVFLTRVRRRIGYCCFVLRESKDKLSMVPRQGQTCRGYPFLGPENEARQGSARSLFCWLRPSRSLVIAMLRMSRGNPEKRNHTKARTRIEAAKMTPCSFAPSFSPSRLRVKNPCGLLRCARSDDQRTRGSAPSNVSRLDRSGSGYLLPFAQLNSSTRSSRLTRF